jgi:hypothetical protein
MDADMSDTEILGGVIPEAEDSSSSEDEDGKDKNWLTDIYRSPEHLLNEECVISASLEDIEGRNPPISQQLSTSIQESQVESPPIPAGPLAVLNEPIPQTVVTMPLVDSRTNGQFTIDAPKTQAGGRLPGWVAYTEVDRCDRIKLSSLHRSGNCKLLQVENRISNYTFVTQKWERRVNSNEGNYIY